MKFSVVSLSELTFFGALAFFGCNAPKNLEHVFWYDILKLEQSDAGGFITHDSSVLPMVQLLIITGSNVKLQYRKTSGIRERILELGDLSSNSTCTFTG